MAITSASDVTTASNVNIFASGNVQAGDSIEIGDIVGALGLGLAAYLFVVGFFLIGHLLSIKSFFDAMEQQKSATRGFNITRHLISVVGWFVTGLLAFTFITASVEAFYNVDVASRIKFFWEARYSVLESSLAVSATNLEIAKSLLFVLDTASKACYWGIVVIFSIIILWSGGYAIALFSHNRSNQEDFGHVAKGLGSAFIVFVLDIILFGAYAGFINSMLLSGSPNIPDMGTVSSVYDIYKESLAYLVKSGLTGKLN